PLMLVGDSRVASELLHLIEHRLELADEDHVAMDATRLLRTNASVGELILESPSIGIYGDRAKLDRFGASYLVGHDHQGFDHRERSFVFGAPTQAQPVEKACRPRSGP